MKNTRNGNGSDNSSSCHGDHQLIGLLDELASHKMRAHGLKWQNMDWILNKTWVNNGQRARLAFLPHFFLLLGIGI